MDQEESIICPITRKIFLEPVITNTWITYEKNSIEKWMKIKNTCPMTNQKTTLITPNFKIKNDVD